MALADFVQQPSPAPAAPWPAVRMAELGCATRQIAAVSGHPIDFANRSSAPIFLQTYRETRI
jgi:hypothetical protein